MREDQIRRFVSTRFDQAFGATADPAYPAWQVRGASGRGASNAAALGYRSAADQRLFLEAYLDRPIEQAVSERLGRAVDRAEIVEIGCLASTSPVALIHLWHDTATALGAGHALVVATVTATVRRLLGRAGVPLVEIARADPGRLADAARWGSYYDDDPRVCVGVIADGVAGLGRYVALRTAAA